MRQAAASRERRRYMRLALWENEVLAKVDDPAACQRVILQRQSEVDDDRQEAEEVAAQFRAELRRRGHNPDRECVFIPSAIAAAWLAMATGHRLAPNKATTFLKTLSISELRPTKITGRPGWRWTGPAAVASLGRVPAAQRLRGLPADVPAAVLKEGESDAGQVNQRLGQVRGRSGADCDSSQVP
jgi:hypothetical protein